MITAINMSVSGVQGEYVQKPPNDRYNYFFANSDCRKYVSSDYCTNTLITKSDYT